MLGCFKPILGHIWTNPIVGLKNAIYKFNPTAGGCPYLTQNWLKITPQYIILIIVRFSNTRRILSCICFSDKSNILQLVFEVVPTL